MKFEMNDNPLVSVIMSTFNEEIRFIHESIESVLNQTYTKFEFIIVLDSVDRPDIEEVLEDYSRKDKRVILLKNKKNIGLPASLNKAISVSKGELIARMDADDICIKNRFEIQVRYLLKHEEVDLCATNIIKINEDSKIIDSSIDSFVCSRKFLKKYIWFRDFFAHPTWMFKRRVLNRLKGYRLFSVAEDYDFICRAILSNLVCVNIDVKLLKYRVRGEGLTLSKSHQVYFISQYIRKLYFQKKIFHKDFFNQRKLENMLMKLKSTEQNYNMSDRYYLQAKNHLQKKSFLKTFYYLSKAFLTYPLYVSSRVVNMFISKAVRTIYKKYYSPTKEL